MKYGRAWCFHCFNIFFSWECHKKKKKKTHTDTESGKNGLIPLSMKRETYALWIQFYPATTGVHDDYCGFSDHSQTVDPYGSIRSIPQFYLGYTCGRESIMQVSCGDAYNVFLGGASLAKKS